MAVHHREHWIGDRESWERITGREMYCGKDECAMLAQGKLKSYRAPAAIGDDISFHRSIVRVGYWAMRDDFTWQDRNKAILEQAASHLGVSTQDVARVAITLEDPKHSRNLADSNISIDRYPFNQRMRTFNHLYRDTNYNLIEKAREAAARNGLEEIIDRRTIWYQQHQTFRATIVAKEVCYTGAYHKYDKYAYEGAHIDGRVRHEVYYARIVTSTDVTSTDSMWFGDRESRVTIETENGYIWVTPSQMRLVHPCDVRDTTSAEYKELEALATELATNETWLSLI
jgi:hypothetical protein